MFLSYINSLIIGLLFSVLSLLVNVNNSVGFYILVYMYRQSEGAHTPTLAVDRMHVRLIAIPSDSSKHMHDQLGRAYVSS